VELCLLGWLRPNFSATSRRSSCLGGSSAFPTTAVTPPFTFPSIDTFAAIREVYRVLFLSPIDA